MGASRSRSKTFEGQRIYIKGDLESDAKVGGLQKMVQWVRKLNVPGAGREGRPSPRLSLQGPWTRLLKCRSQACSACPDTATHFHPVRSPASQALQPAGMIRARTERAANCTSYLAPTREGPCLSGILRAKLRVCAHRKL